MPFQNLPVVNGLPEDLADQPYRLIRQGQFYREADVLIGNNADEGTIFVYEGDGTTLNVNQTLYDRLLYSTFAARSDLLISYLSWYIYEGFFSSF